MKAKDTVIKLIYECGVSGESISCSDTELKLLGLDSLSFIQLIVNLEKELDIAFNDEMLDISNYACVKDLVLTVELLLGEKL